MNACRFFGGAYVTERPDGSFPLVNVLDGGGAQFRYVRFTAGRYRLSAEYTAFSDCRMAVDIDGEVAAEALLSVGEKKAVCEFDAKGRDSALTFTFRGGPGRLCEVSSWEISPV